jgi:putative ABC transport system ATP-binding protein
VLRGSVGAYRRHVAVAAALLCGHQTGEALVPVLVGVVIDEAVTTGDPRALIGWLLVLGLDFTMLSWCYRWGARRSWLADVRADQRLRLQLTDRVLDPRGGAEAGRLPGGLASIATSDAKRVGIVNFALPLGFAAVVALAVATVALLRISIPLGLLILLGTPPLLYLVYLLGKPLERRSGPEQERAAQASGVAADLVSGVRVLKGIGAEPAAVRHYAARHRRPSLVPGRRARGERAVPRARGAGRRPAGGSGRDQHRRPGGSCRARAVPYRAAADFRVGQRAAGSGPRVGRADR